MLETFVNRYLAPAKTHETVDYAKTTLYKTENRQWNDGGGSEG